MRRRSFIVTSILATGGAIAGGYLYRSTVQSDAELAVGGIVSKLAELPPAVRFGATFRQQLQKDDQPMKSLKSLSITLADAHGNLHPGNVGSVLEQQIQAELESGQLQLIDGWYLTRTELDLCALASISREP